MSDHSARELKQRVTLLTKSRVSDGGGGYKEVYAPSSPATVLWAGISQRGSGEGFADGRRSTSQDLVVTIRYQASVVPSMRLLWGTTEYEIFSVSDVGNYHRWMELRCSERPGE
jgi:SPP1 family predicted phage head-tail adaptor